MKDFPQRSISGDWKKLTYESSYPTPSQPKKIEKGSLRTSGGKPMTEELLSTCSTQIGNHQFALGKKIPQKPTST